MPRPTAAYHEVGVVAGPDPRSTLVIRGQSHAPDRGSGRNTGFGRFVRSAARFHCLAEAAASQGGVKGLSRAARQGP